MTWILNQANRIVFVMVDATNTEVSGIGDGNLTVTISKNGGAFAAALGTDTEIGNGWYTYLADATEADTVGPVAVKVTGAGAIQQNLEYVVKQRNPGAIEWDYDIQDALGNPLEGVSVWVTATNSSTAPAVWAGTTNGLGEARDENGDYPFLDAGTWYFWRQRAGYNFSNPDTEVVA